MAYNYANYAGVPPQVDPRIAAEFQRVDVNGSGKLSRSELQKVFVNLNGKNFSRETCVLLSGMFDTDQSGALDLNEFTQLYYYVQQWLEVFCRYDMDGSGSISGDELKVSIELPDRFCRLPCESR